MIRMFYKSLLSDEESPMLTQSVGDTIEIEGEFTRYIYEKESFAIANFIDDTYEEFTVLGNIPFELVSGRVYRISGEIEESFNKFKNAYVRQLRLKGITLLPPSGETGIVRYLQTIDGLLTRAFFLYETYKEDTIAIMKKDPERVAREIKGISLKQALKFQAQLLEQEDSSETLTFLLNIGLTLKESEMILRSNGETVQEDIMKNPYLLTNRYHPWPAMSFVRVDKLAKEWKLPAEMPERIQAGIIHILEKESAFGHCFSDWDTVLNNTYQALKRGPQTVEKEIIENNIESLLLENVLFLDIDRLYLKRVFETERDLAENINRLSKELPWSKGVDVHRLVDEYVQEKGLELASKQVEAIKMSLSNKGELIVINGAAGTGKTFTVDIIMQLLIQTYEKEGNRERADITVLAPTGKAAKVLRKSLNYKYTTMTIHRALKAEGHKFYHNMANKLTSNIYIIDETSMLDTELANALLQAIPTNSKVIFLGDVRQLPAIGAGNVLSDLIKSEMVKVVTLDEPKRQEKGSSIYENARRILEFKMIEPDNKDTFWIKSSNAHQARVKAIKAIDRIRTYQPEDIQVLSPMKKGQCGTLMLNRDLQSLWNGKQEDSKILNRSFKVDGATYQLYFRIGDKVMQTKNNPDLKWVKKNTFGEYEVDEAHNGQVVTNGEQGIIESIFEESIQTNSGRYQNILTIAVRYDEGVVLYQGSDKKDLDHAYAITVHKSQGSQWPVVVMVMDQSHYVMLGNELLYTGKSRAEEKDVLVSDVASIQMAIKEMKSIKRNTSLIERLKEIR